MGHPRFTTALLTVCGTVLVTACASSSGPRAPSEATRPSRVVTTLGTTTGSSTGARNGSLDYYTDEGYESAELPLAVEEVWPLLLQAYDDLEITLGMMDTEAFIVGNPSFVAPRRVAGHRMSRMFRCGETMTGPVADASTVTINVETRLDEFEGGSLVSTLVRGSAIPRDGTGTVRPCTSTGQLEIEIHEAILKLIVLGGPGS